MTSLVSKHSSLLQSYRLRHLRRKVQHNVKAPTSESCMAGSQAYPRIPCAWHMPWLAISTEEQKRHHNAAPLSGSVACLVQLGMLPLVYALAHGQNA